RWSGATDATARCRSRSIGYGRKGASRGGWPWTWSATNRRAAVRPQCAASTRSVSSPITQLPCYSLRIYLLDNRADDVDRIAHNTRTEALVCRVDGSVSLRVAVGDIRRQWRSHYRARSQGLYVLSHGSPGHLLLGTEGLGEPNVSLLEPLHSVVGGCVQLWGCNVAAARLVGNNIIDGKVGSFDEYDGASESMRRMGVGYRFLLELARTLH